VKYDNTPSSGMFFGRLKVIIPNGVDEMIVNSGYDFCEIWKNKLVTPKRKSNWNGKKILWIGTSIPEKDNYVSGGNYPEQVAAALGAEVINVALGSSMARKGYLSKVTENDQFGISGVGFTVAAKAMGMTVAEKQELIDNWDTKWDQIITGGSHGSLTNGEKALMISASYENRLVSHLDDVDLIVLDHGRNDYSSNPSDNQMDANNPFDMRTYQGAMNTYIKLIFENNIHKKVIIMSHYESQQFVGLIDMQQQVADYWNIPICRICDSLGWAYDRKVTLYGSWNLESNHYFWRDSDTPHEYRLTEAHIPDGTHPGKDISGKACRDIAQKIIPFINDLGMTDY
jgi:hypothetical protein